LLITIVSIVCFYRHKEIATIRKGEFISRLWDKYPEYRHFMLEDMERKINIRSLSRDEIIIELGTNKVSVRDDCIFYVIKGSSGPWKALSLVPQNIEYYCIKCADDGKVDDTYIWVGS